MELMAVDGTDSPTLGLVGRWVLSPAINTPAHSITQPELCMVRSYTGTSLKRGEESHGWLLLAGKLVETWE